MFYSKPLAFGVKTAHLIFSDHPHASTTSSIGRFEDDGETVCLGKHLRLMQTGDGGICSWDHRYTCPQTEVVNHTGTPEAYKSLHQDLILLVANKREEFVLQNKEISFQHKRRLISVGFKSVADGARKCWKMYSKKFFFVPVMRKLTATANAGRAKPGWKQEGAVKTSLYNKSKTCKHLVFSHLMKRNYIHSTC